jgi:RimJ/RimL family protein N-acetyltransferase
MVETDAEADTYSEVGIMTAVRPGGEALEGRFIRLSLLTRAELPELFAAIAHPEVYTGGYGGGPAGLRGTVETFAEWAETYYPWDAGNVYGIRVVGGPDAGTLVGTSTLTDFDLAREHAHIGWTAYNPRVWGTAVNPEAKLLMLSLAFESGFGRVKIQTDAINARSRAAIAKLGAQFEGFTRRDIRRADGTWRDSAVFSVLVDEWPAVKAGLERRLSAFGVAPVELSRDS